MGNSTSVIGNESNVLAGFFKGNAEKLISATKVLTVADLDCMNVCSGTTADYSVYLPKPADCIGHYIGFRMDPGLTKLVTLNAGQTDNLKTGTVQVRTGTNITTQFVRSPDGLTYYTGTSLTVDTWADCFRGDKITFTCTNSGVQNVTLSMCSSASCVTAANYTWNDTNNFLTGYRSATGIIGTNTTFLTDLSVGGTIWVGGESRTVTWIGDDTHCAVSNVFSTAGSGLTYSAAGTPYIIDGEQKRIMWANEVAILYSDGYKWVKVAGKSIPMSGCLRVGANQTFSSGTTTVLTCFTSSYYLNAPSAFQTAASSKFTILRPGKYEITVEAATTTGNTSASDTQIMIAKNGGNIRAGETGRAANQSAYLHASCEPSLVADDVITLKGYYYGGSFTTAYLGSDTGYNEFRVTEIPTW